MTNQFKSHLTQGRFFLVSIMLFQQFLGGLTFPVAKYGLQQIEPVTRSFVLGGAIVLTGVLITEW